ncbi:MAG: TolC family protein [Planctomycetes bacterium]|nr:TolC family protein [Planctomycetota bacterium]
MRILSLVVAMAAISMSSGCRRWYAADADRQVYATLKDEHKYEFGYDRTFTIDDGPSRNLGLTAEEIIGDLPLAGPLPEMMAESELGHSKAPLRKMDLATALSLGKQNSREFQSQKESVYTAALSYTTQRHVFEPQLGLTGDVMRTADRSSGDDTLRTLATNGNFSLSQRLTTGALIALDLGITGLKYLNDEFGTTLESALSVSFEQPLWRDSDRLVVANQLIQSQHDVVYQLRRFARYEKSFCVDLATRYYNVLQQLDVVRNEWDNYNNLTVNMKRSEALAEAGRLPMFEVDQARQDQLRAHSRYLSALENYERQLDTFRVFLGLPTDTPVVLDGNDMKTLVDAGIAELPQIGYEKAMAVALARRLDLKNTRGQIDDAEREVTVAADALKGDVRLVGGMNVHSMPQAKAGRFMFHEGIYEFGLEVDLPLDRLNERNAYRNSLIDYDVALRTYMEQVDTIKQSIRQSLRQLRTSQQTYEIQKNSVDLARRRVSSTQKLLDAGRADTRDVLDSQDALVTAQNALSQALVAHRIARLEFLRDMELLEVDERGQIHEGSLDGINEAGGSEVGPANDGR